MDTLGVGASQCYANSASMSVAAQFPIDHTKEGIPMKVWQCKVCGFTYDEARGLPAEGIAPGTRWQDIPGDWVCPDCGSAKAEFEMIEVAA